MSYPVKDEVGHLLANMRKEGLEPSDLPDDLRERVSLWSRCNANSRAELMTKQLCEGIMGRFEL